MDGGEDGFLGPKSRPFSEILACQDALRWEFWTTTHLQRLPADDGIPLRQQSIFITKESRILSPDTD